jgi:hypothetical protein
MAITAGRRSHATYNGVQGVADAKVAANGATGVHLIWPQDD